MELPRIETPKIPNMIMCGDHPSFTKNELNMKETKSENKKPEEKITLSNTRISPKSSRADRVERAERERAWSEHGLRAQGAAERRVRSLQMMQRLDVDIAVRRNRTLVQAAVGSFRWPPYLVAVWVLVLLLTHLLHCLVNMLERALPPFKNLCGYFRSWTEESWKAERDGSKRVCPAALACLTGLLYSVYYVLYGVNTVAVWSVEPLCSEAVADAIADAGEDSDERVAPKITNYDEDITATSNP